MAREYQDLLDSPGWALLSKIVQEQLAARVNDVMLVPSGGGDGNPISALLNAEYMKGEYNGHVSVMHLPQVQISMLQAMITKLEENEDAPGSDNSSSP
jgi:hypothetical protein